MKNMTKGGLAMVFAGAVTFSVANAWLDGEPTKLLLTKVKTITESLNRKTADDPHLIEKKAENQKPTTILNELTAVPSRNVNVLQVSNKNESKTVRVKPSSPIKNTENLTKQVAIHYSNRFSTMSHSQKVNTTKTSSNSSHKTTITKTTAGTGKTATTPSVSTANGADTSTKNSSAKSANSKAGITTKSTTNHGKQVSSVEKDRLKSILFFFVDLECNFGSLGYRVNKIKI